MKFKIGDLVEWKSYIGNLKNNSSFGIIIEIWCDEETQDDIYRVLINNQLFYIHEQHLNLI